ncbi:MAG: sensor histidine kinase [Myxococcales bacterium]
MTKTLREGQLWEMAEGTATKPSAEDPLDAWRRKATNAYSLFVVVAHLPFVLAVVTHRLVLSRHGIAVMAAWSLTLGAALLRRLAPTARVWLLVLAVWVYAGIMLDRGGIFFNFRGMLIGSPLAVLILAGVRRGLVVGAINMLLTVAAIRATEAGWLRQVPLPWQSGEWRVQAVGVLGAALPQYLLLAWFSHHLSTSVRREAVTAARLRAEAADRERLEGEVLEAGERECRRIGSELHDGVCQDLTGLLIRSKRAQKALEALSNPEAEALRSVVEGLGEAIGEVHGLSRRLSPGRLTGRDLAGAVDDLVRRTAEVADVSISFMADGDGPTVDPVVTLHLFRVAQEALANAVRHAAATQIEILLAHDPEGTRIRVDDDGVGLPADAALRGGLGLRTLRWRAVKAGGTLTVGPRPGGGTRVECSVPRTEAGKETESEL